jgi:DNA primase
VEEVRVPDALPGLSEQPGVALLLETIAFVSSNPGHRTAAIVEHFRDHPEGRHLERLLAGEMLVAPDQAAAELEDTLHRIVADARSARLEELVARAKDGPLDEAEKEEFRALQSAVAQAPRGSGTNEADS